MTAKKRIILIALCFAIAIVIIVCWIVSSYAIHHMDNNQGLQYAKFFGIKDPIDGYDEYFGLQVVAVMDDFDAVLSSGIDYRPFVRQVKVSLAIIHLCFAVITVGLMTTGTVLAAKLVKGRKESK